MSSAVRTFLTIHGKDLPPSLVFFCTQASAGAEGTFQEMASIIGKKPILTIAYTSKAIKKNIHQQQLSQQLSSILPQNA